MARRIKSRIKINGKLQAKTALHFGGNEVNADTDSALAVNGRGDYYLAGTNLTGLLRAWMTRIAKKTDVNVTQDDIKSLWGFQDGDLGQASFIYVEDGAIALPDDLTAEIRDGVGIDRISGTAADRQKYDREIVPKGSAIAFNLTVERGDCKDDDQWSQEKELLAKLLQALKEQELRVGGGKTRGLGKVELVDLEIWEQPDLLTPKGILKALRGKEKKIELQPLNPTIKPPQLKSVVGYAEFSSASPTLKITIEWQPLTPVMLKSEAEGIAVDVLPLVSGNDDGLSLIITGSAIKGILRSQAEKIVRTVCDRDLPDDFLSQVQVDLVKTLFGSAAQIKAGKQQGYQGALAIDDCYADLTFPSAQWYKIQTAKDSPELLEALKEAGLTSMQQAFHVAIDRWTGGAADSALYSVLEPLEIEWSPMELTINLNRLKRGKDNKDYIARITLLFLVLRDLMNRRIPIGFGTNRGMGDIKVAKITTQGMENISELSNPNNITFTDEELPQKKIEVLQQLTTAWKSWIAKEASK